MIIALGIFFLSLFVIYIVLLLNIIFKLGKNWCYKSHLERELWEKLINNVDDFQYVDNWGPNYIFFSSDGYTAYVSRNGTCSIHVKNSATCVLSPLDEKMSRKMAELLMNKIQKK